jgi:chemotaxis protein methyltransferase CheR
LILIKTISRFFLLVADRDVIQECVSGRGNTVSTLREQQPKRRQKQKEVERHRLEAALEEGLEETFPASDAVAVTEPRRQAMPVPDIVPHVLAGAGAPLTDSGCTAFLQWALPQLELHWSGFRKVRRQVCKRLTRRMRELGLDNFAVYRVRLEADPTEWRVIDQCCHITISRFFRERGVFDLLRTRVLPDIAARAAREGRNAKVWSAGCASGEEPYTIKILWDVEVARSYPTVSLSIIASDVDAAMLARAREGCFEPTSLHELPPPLVERAFEQVGPLYCVKSKHREGIEFLDQDLRSEMPLDLFDLILCRYVAFTYFTVPLQRKVIVRVLDRLRPNGFFVIGAHEQLPGDISRLVSLIGEPPILQKRAGPQSQ